MLVDTDFLLALLKPEDWLKPSAEAALKAHRGKLRSTEANLVELLFVLRRQGLDTRAIVAAVDQIAPFDDPALAWLAARRVQEGMTPVDAVLAAHMERNGEPIVSSDAAFDQPGLERIALRAQGRKE